MTNLLLYPSAILLGAALILTPLAAASALALPFGGQIYNIQICDIPPALLLTLGPPTPGDYLLLPNSILFPYFSIHPLAWLLGLYASTPTPCKKFFGDDLRVIGLGYPIIYTGTSR